jgi:hypothetical protein
MPTLRRFSKIEKQPTSRSRLSAYTEAADISATMLAIKTASLF